MKKISIHIDFDPDDYPEDAVEEARMIFLLMKEFNSHLSIAQKALDRKISEIQWNCDCSEGKREWFNRRFGMANERCSLCKKVH
ncbi:MAG: hypothetical protein V1851_02090 [Patescibacteria group bacterium]